MNGATRIAAILACLTAQTVSSGQTAPASKPRSYATGPLTAADFQAPVPAKPPEGIQALTETEVNWQIEYSTRRERNSWFAELRRVQVYATVRPDHSWNSDPRSSLLLDHGQGHFDLTQGFALEWQRRLREEIADGTPLTGRGETSSKAIADLDQQLRRRVDADRYLLEERHQIYDRETDHGRRAAELMKHREQQRHRLLELNPKKITP